MKSLYSSRLNILVTAAIILLSNSRSVQAQDPYLEDFSRYGASFAKLVVDQADPLLGATLQPVSEALRAQLDIPAGQGLVVASLQAESASAQVGLQQNDILLTLAEKALGETDDVSKLLKAAGDVPVSLKVMRGGKTITIPVRPVYHVTLGPVVGPKNEYFIGVSVEAVDEALRAQLDLVVGLGLLINDVTGGSPAEKAGVKKHDIILELGGKSIDSAETLVKEVQAAQDKPTTLKLLRGGKSLSLPVTGAVRKAQRTSKDDAIRLWLVERDAGYRTMAGKALWEIAGKTAVPTATADIRQQLEQLTEQMKTLQRIEAIEKDLKSINQSLEKMNEYLKANKGTKRD